MAIIHALEDLDPGLAITQVLNQEKSAAQLPTHDQLYLDKAKEVKAAEEKKEDQPDPSDNPEAADGGEETPPGSTEEVPAEGAEPSPEDDSADEDADEQEPALIDSKQTTVATEALRHDDYSLFAVESFGEESLASKAGQMAWSGIKHLSSFALSVATELGMFLKDLGIAYGPKVYASLRSGVSYLLTKLFKSFAKMRAAATKSYFQYTHSFKKHGNRLRRLKQILQELPDNVVLVQQEPFQDEKLFKLFQVGSTVSPMKAVAAIDGLLDVVVGDIDQGIHNEIQTMQRVIEVCQRNARIDVLHYLTISNLNSGFLKRAVHGYENNPDLLDSYVYSAPLPRDTLLMAAIPKKEVVISASKSNDMADVTKAYQESYFILGVNQVMAKTSPLVNYMDKKSLLSLLDRLETVVDKAASHVSFYKRLEEAGAKLKPGFQNYFGWLVEDEQAKTLREALTDVIYLKQMFITRVYLPGAIDIHDFVSSYVSGILGYVEKNIEVLKPSSESSAV